MAAATGSRDSAMHCMARDVYRAYATSISTEDPESHSVRAESRLQSIISAPDLEHPLLAPFTADRHFTCTVSETEAARGSPRSRWSRERSPSWRSIFMPASARKEERSCPTRSSRIRTAWPSLGKLRLDMYDVCVSGFAGRGRWLDSRGRHVLGRRNVRSAGWLSRLGKPHVQGVNAQRRGCRETPDSERACGRRNRGRGVCQHCAFIALVPLN